MHIIVVDGQVVGGWKRKPIKSKMEIKTNILMPLNDDQHGAIRKAAERYSQFLGLPVVLDGQPIT